jgi:hypothetical protein
MSVAGDVTWTRLGLTRPQILAFRQRVGALNERLPPGQESLRRAAWAGLQDSMPRAALLSIHTRVERTGPSTWEDPSLVQLWGPPPCSPDPARLARRPPRRGRDRRDLAARGRGADRTALAAAVGRRARYGRGGGGVPAAPRHQGAGHRPLE